MEGTRHVIEFANAHDVGRFHHISSIAVAGSYRGVFQEDMFDEGQRLPHHYHRTKYESERLVRDGVEAKTLDLPPRHRRRPLRDRRDGQDRRALLLLQAAPAAAPRAARVVPARRARRAARRTSCRWTSWPRRWTTSPTCPTTTCPGDTFHLVEPRADDGGRGDQRVRQGRPRAAVRDARGRERDERDPQAGARRADGAADRQADPQPALHDLGIPPAAMENRDFHCKFDARDTQRALTGTGIAVPPLSTYAPALWDYWERNLDPDLFRERSLASAIKGKRILITGASSGIGLETAMKIGEAGGEVILVSRTREKLEEVAEQVRGARRHRPRAPGRPVRPRRHRPAGGRGARAARRRGRARQQRRPLDPALGEGVVRPLPRLRAHDAAELLRRAQADPRVPAGDARAALGPHHERVLDRRADEHAALLGLRGVEVGAGRVLALRGPRGDRRQRQVHHRLHAARAHADDRAHRHLQGLPHAHAGGGGADALRRDDRQAEADGLAARHVRRDPLLDLAEDRGHHAQHRLQPLPRLARPRKKKKAELVAGRRPSRSPSRRCPRRPWRWPTSCAACTSSRVRAA